MGKDSTVSILKVLVSILAIDRNIEVDTAKTLLIMGADPRAEVEFMFAQDMPVDTTRNKIIDDFLESGCDWLISIDDDVGCEKNPIDLCFLGKDIIFLPTPIIQGGKLTINVDYLEEGKGLREIKKGGTGCFVLSRKAAEIIEKPLFKFLYDQNGYCILGEDYYFSENARKNFKLYAHTDYLCKHIKGIDLLTLSGNFFRR